MTQTYYTIDIEHAYDVDAVFEYGLCKVQNDDISNMETWHFEVNPDAGSWDSFFGQSSEDYEDKPLWTTVPEFLVKNIEEDAVIFHHYGEEKRRLDRLFNRYGLKLHFNVINTSSLVKEYLSDLAMPVNNRQKESYSLERLAGALNVDFEAHNALEDARALAYIVDEMIQRVGFNELLNIKQRKHRKIYEYQKNFNKSLKSGEIVSSGSYFGKKILFTATTYEERLKLAKDAKEAGFEVITNVSKKLDYLVKGNLENSKKPEKAEKLNKEMGSSISIISISEFYKLIEE